MDMFQRVLLVDPATDFYKIRKYGFGRYFGPVDPGIHLAEEYRSLNFGVRWKRGRWKRGRIYFGQVQGTD